ncbi:type II toxin-antitoxin system HipA family toxin [Asticcacaulis sp. SL142]|uniref:type II toxin-antitoxin system HipA family toxin n=1 Tax=Asticcacaulis sp. SL142 TaxID=2995155 RepID=UPI00226CA029|nr:type II toxin-antitoxin system HipA family toxin [Asticcacaulis sp. SL142]WAC47228.1 type II toxin-antitoxin system HipA family toxin [Asticcacaulis sp. SL142]
MKLFYERYLVGEIITGEAAPGFSYARDWLAQPGAFPISTTLPLRAEPYPWEVVAPWLINLLPEDSDALRMMARLLDVPYTDILGLLARIGRDTSGAISFGERGATGGEARAIGSEADLERVINELPQKPFLAGEDGVSMSLAGVQTKLAVRLTGEGAVAIPLNGAASSHILKPDSPRLPGGVHNEALCLTLAGMVGLRAPKVTTGRAGARTYLLVERYDRLTQGDHLRRLHQEDFCQALGLPPSAKYQHDHTTDTKGSFAAMMDRLRAIGGGADVLRLWDMLVFNVLCCNTDAHLKNYSVLIRAEGVELAPIYDVMCAKVFDGITENLALDVGGKRRGDYIEGHHWAREADTCGLSSKLALERVRVLAGAVTDQLPAAIAAVEALPAGGHRGLNRVVEAITRRCSLIVRALER